MKKLPLLLPILLVGALLLSTTRGQAQAPTPQPYPTGQYPAQITLQSAADLETLYRLNIDIGSLRAAAGTLPAAGDTFETLIATVYITPAEAQALASAGLQAVPIPNPSQKDGPHQPSDWPTYSELVTRMQGIASGYPNLVRLVSIGKSVNNRDIWCLKVTDNPDAEEDEPEVKFSAAIHGDERWPSWSPSGHFVAFYYNYEGQDMLCIMNADGSSGRCFEGITGKRIA